MCVGVDMRVPTVCVHAYIQYDLNTSVILPILFQNSLLHIILLQYEEVCPAGGVGNTN